MMKSYLQPIQRKKKHRVAKIVTAVVLVILIVFGVLAVLLFRDDKAGLSANPSADVVKTILSNAITGKQSELSADQLNQLFAYQFEHKKSSASTFKSVYLTINPDNTVDVYTPVTLKGMHFGITSNANITYDSGKKQLVATVNSLHVGRLGVPVNWALNMVKDKFPAGITLDGNKLSVDSSLFSVSVQGKKDLFSITGLEVKNNKFLLQTTGMADLIKDYLLKSVS